MPSAFQGPLGYPGERGIRGEPVSHLHPEQYGVYECRHQHVVAGYIAVNYTNQQHGLRENELSPVKKTSPLMFWRLRFFFFLCPILSQGSPGPKGEPGEKGLPVRKLLIVHRVHTCPNQKGFCLVLLFNEF